MLLKAVAVFAVLLFQGKHIECYSQAEINSLYSGKTWQNMQDVLQGVGFENLNNPYGPANAEIDKSVDCYIRYEDDYRDTYTMNSWTESEAAQENTTGTRASFVFKSHLNKCGACSNMIDLGIYLGIPDLTTPVRQCAIDNGYSDFTLGILGQDGYECLREIGFSEACAKIWLYNIEETTDKCRDICQPLVDADNIEPNPSQEALEEYGNPCDPASCPTTINGQDTCTDDMWKSGSETRLNACLQCDECNSGPIFQKVAGRTRRGSGIRSAIERDESAVCTDCWHGHGAYILQQGNTRRPTQSPTSYPTKSPTTGSPTYVPVTSAPTGPTFAPTLKPTRAPTTKTPTKFPTTEVPTSFRNTSPEEAKTSAVTVAIVGVTLAGFGMGTVFLVRRINKGSTDDDEEFPPEFEFNTKKKVVVNDIDDLPNGNNAAHPPSAEASASSAEEILVQQEDDANDESQSQSGEESGEDEESEEKQETWYPPPPNI